jgi:RimJ/RimL family protein N-acetyltransferase
MTVAETQRLYLRRFTPDDAGLLFDLDSDPEVMRYVSSRGSTPLEVIRDKILPRWIAQYEEYEHRGFWAAHLRDTGEFIGWFHLKPDPDEAATADIGYRLGRSAWNNGYATEGSRALLEAAFGRWGVEKVTAHALERNVASRRVLEKIRLRYVKTFVVPESVLPGWTEEQRRAVAYELTKGDYEHETGALSGGF